MIKTLKRDMILAVTAIFLLAGYYGLEGLKVRTEDQGYPGKLEASLLMQRSMEVLKEEQLKRGAVLDLSTDINGTGIIGEEWSPITTTLGSLESKRTSANPNFAAVIVDMFEELGLRKGDRIAVNFSGSFPAVNIAVLSAAQVLQLEPVSIASIGASTWGANKTDFTFVDMWKTLNDKGILTARPAAVSAGGSDDMGRDMESALLEGILQRARSNGAIIIRQPDLALNLKERLQIYDNSKENPIKCFVNVGGNLPAFGGDESIPGLRPGIVRELKAAGHKKDGLIQEFLKEGIPVIQLLDIKKLAVEYGLPVDPYPMPEAGRGDVYYEYRYRYSSIPALFCISLAGVAYYVYTARRCNGR